MKRKVFLIVIVALFLSSSWVIAQESKVRVVVDKARIYAESSTDSYRIETIKKRTILSLFGTKQTDENWLYVYYQSPRWNSKVTGFIQAEVVEEYSEAQKDEAKPEIQPEEIPEEKPLSHSIGQNPRFYDVTTEVESEAGILPTRENRAVQVTDKINTELWKEEVVIPETTEVTEKERDIKKAYLPEKMEEPPKITRLRPHQGRSLFTLSLGYGPSLGGFGGFIQLNTSRDFSVHLGFGYYPTSMFYPDYDWVKGKALYSVGVKYYLPWKTDQVRPYVDLQYGQISVEAVRIITGIWHYTFIYKDIHKTLWGPSLLTGLELRIGSFGLNGAVGASYVTTKWEYWDQPLFLTADVGFLLYF